MSSKAPLHRTPAIMIQGTGSDVGKSLVVAGLARLFARRGLRVHPFKPQNMSNNAAAVAGGEIGRAQALQARAAGVPATIDMNPILLKPQGGGLAQLVVQGLVSPLAPRGVLGRDYAALKPQLMPAVLESWRRVAVGADLLLVEGAGSPAEVNLRDHDLANMGFAEAADLPVILVGDIERGGVIAALVGTYRLLSEPERRRVKAYIINRFRGDVRLFDGAVTRIAAETAWDCLGILPWLEQARLLPAEDSLSLKPGSNPVQAEGRRIRIVVPLLPHGANLDDLDPLRAEPRVELILVPSGVPLPAEAQLVIITGSKATLSDLASLRREGWDGDLRGLYRRGTRILGLCGGYQMLGQTIADPQGLEGARGNTPTPGLGLLAVETSLNPQKTIRTIQGTAGGSFGDCSLTGYEIHLGHSQGEDCRRPFLPGLMRDFPASAGATSADGLIMGSYLHGLLANDSFRHSLLRQIAPEFTSHLDYERQIELSLDSLADHLEAHIDCERILNLARD